MRKVIAVAGLLVCGQSFALSPAGYVPRLAPTATGFVAEYAGGTTTVGRNFAVAPSGASIHITDAVKAIMKSGQVVNMTSTRAVAMAAGKGLITAIALGGGPDGIAGAIAIGTAISVANVMLDGGFEPNATGTGFQVDPGQARQPGYCYLNAVLAGPTVCLSAEEGLTRYKQHAQNVCYGNGASATWTLISSGISYGPDGTAYISLKHKCGVSPAGLDAYGSSDDTHSHPPQAGVICPAITLAPLVIVHGDQPCPSDNRRDATPPEVKDWVDNLPPDVVRKGMEDIWKETGPGGIGSPGAKKWGMDQYSKTPSEGVTIGGPASAFDPKPTKTTKPSGEVVEETTRYDFEYGPETVNITTTTVNTTTIDSTTTTETVENPDEKDERSECEKNPNTIGCAEFGEPDTQEPSRGTKPVTFDPGDEGEAATCPADESFSVYGKSYAISWTPICDAAQVYVKPVILVLAAAAGAFIFIGGLKA